MDFKNWLLIKENITVNDNGQEFMLTITEPNLIKDFNYQFEDGYSNFSILPFHATQIGYANIGTQSNYIGIIKNTPIEAGKGIDVAFIKNLHSILTRKYNKIQYKDGENVLLKQLPQIKQPEQQYQNSSVPDLQGSSNQQKITKSMSASKATGSWAFFLRTESANYTISKIIEDMEIAIKPLMDNNLVEFYEISDRMSRKNKFVYSNSGKDSADEWKNDFNRKVSYIKYLADFLPNKAKELVLSRINTSNKDWPARKLEPQNNKIPMMELFKIINQSYAEDLILKFAVKSVFLDNRIMKDVLEIAAEQQYPGVVLNAFEELSELDPKLVTLDLETDLENPIRYLGRILEVLTGAEPIKHLIENKLNKFKSKLEESLIESIQKETHLSHYDIKTIIKLSQFIEIPKEILNHLKKLDEEGDANKKKQEEEKKQKIEYNKTLLTEGSLKYIILTEGSNIKDVPTRYNNGGEMQDEGEFALKYIVDSSEVMDAAIEQATEDAYQDIEEKPSEHYGKDQKEVDDDIKYEMDDFINDENIDIPNNISDDDLIKLIKNDYLNKFINWKIEKLKHEEEQESWKYEPELDEKDVYKYAEEFAVEKAFDSKGLVIIGHSGKSLDITLSSKFKEKFNNIIKNILLNNRKEKDEFQSPLIPLNMKINFYYIDKHQSDVTNVNNIINGS